jgi:pilus assembly protein CpaF
MINALSTFIPHSERVITIEDAYELALDTPHWVALQTKESSSADDEIVISMADLLVTTLRMRPDRIIVGEIREPRGASVMLQAANTGHDGTMTTIHANSADRALNFRMVGFARTGSSMTAEVAAAEVSSAINLVIQVVRRAGRRFISEIAVVDPSMLHSGLISPVHIFKGELIDGKPSFKRYGAVDGDTEIGMKLEDKGLLGKWDL